MDVFVLVDSKLFFPKKQLYFPGKNFIFFQ